MEALLQPPAPPLSHFIQPQLQVLEGLGKILLISESTYSMQWVLVALLGGPLNGWEPLVYAQPCQTLMLVLASAHLSTLHLCYPTHSLKISLFFSPLTPAVFSCLAQPSTFLPFSRSSKQLLSLWLHLLGSLFHFPNTSL